MQSENELNAHERKMKCTTNNIKQAAKRQRFKLIKFNSSLRDAAEHLMKFIKVSHKLNQTAINCCRSRSQESVNRT